VKHKFQVSKSSVDATQVRWENVYSTLWQTYSWHYTPIVIRMGQIV